MRFLAAMSLAFVLAAGSAEATPLTLFMSPAGSDANDCQSAPCLTLNRILAVVKAVDPQDDIKVKIALGTYVQQTMNGWTYVMPSHTITFVGAGDRNDQTKIPVFDNCSDDGDLATCLHNVWFKLQTSASQNGGHPSNLIFNHLKITHYGEPIWLSGDRSDPANGWNGGNVIENCVFAYDGNYYVPSLPESWATIRLYNSRNNLITHNLFVHIWAATGNLYLHALYIASYSDHNIISRDTFRDVGGDTIRFRDASNYNKVSRSTFWKTGEDAPLTSWFCRPFKVKLCGKTIPECPSTGNVASSNYYTGGDTCPTPPPLFAANLSDIGRCHVPPRKQNIAVRKLTTNFSACNLEP